MDGWITIGTKLDSSQLDKDLKQKEKELNRYEKEAEKLTTIKTKVEIDLKAYDEAKAKIQESTDETLKQAQTSEQVKWVLESEKAELEALNQEYAKPIGKLEATNQKLKENMINQSKIKNELKEINSEISKQKVLDNIKTKIDNVGISLQKSVKHVARWSLALIGVRGMYSAIKGAISLVSSQNESISNSLQGMKNIIASALLPVVQFVVKLMAKLMVYANYIFNRLTGKQLFDFSKAMQGADDGLKNGAKHAKEINKQLAGFDEMNVLQSNTNTSSGASEGAGGVTDFDNSLFKDVKIPGWVKKLGDALKFVKDNWKEILTIAAVFGGILAAIKIAKFLGSLEGVGKALDVIRDAIKNLWEKVLTPFLKFIGEHAVTIGGIIAIIGGLTLAITGIIEYLKDPTWENFLQIIIGVGVAAAGVLLIFGGIPALITLIIGLVAALVVAIVKNWDNITAVLGKVASWIYEKVITPVGNFFAQLWTKLKNGVSTLWNGIIEIIGDIANWINSHIIQPIASFFGSLWNDIKSGVNAAAGVIKSVFNGIVNFFKGIVNSILNLFKKIGTNVGNVIGGAFTAVINAVLGAIENILNSPIKAINALIKTINKVPGINLGKLQTFNLPRLARGGIVNNPGPGVNIGGAIAGEKGPEAVIPLDDATMNRLGQSIARYMVINNTVINKMNARTISKELQIVNNQESFATNS